ncbi:MAG: chemotaxis response regulator protein-glutamate methylesterase [bacterium]
MKRIRVLIVDDSAVVREVLAGALDADRRFQTVGTAPDAYTARNKILKLDPDVVLLDIEMPRMDGLTFLRKLMRYRPTPVIIVSSLTPPGGRMALDAMTSGAMDVVCKPGPELPIQEMLEVLKEKIAAVAAASFVSRPAETEAPAADTTELALPAAARRIVAIGASTGGTQAIEQILRQFPPNCPPTLIVQHMPAYFTTSFAKRLNDLCAPEIREACDNDDVLPGRVLIAPGNRHLLLRPRGGGLRVQVKDGPMVHHQRPSIEVLFQSIVRCPEVAVVAALLTGMGTDGANGLLSLRRGGAHTIAQDQASSVVYGMPAEAVRLGAACEVASLGRMAGLLLAHACE